MWEQFRYGKIDKDTLRNKRFEYTFDDLGIEEVALSNSLSEEYIRIAPYKTNLFPDTHEVLTYLKEKYVLHIITNGFVETQFKKIDRKSTRLNSSHANISYAVFCLKK